MTTFICDDAEAAGLEIMHYENLDRHMENSYRNLAEAASHYSFKSADGMLVEENYRATADVCAQGQIGMNLAVLTQKRIGSRL